ncbi:hypothetical protein LJC74_07795 [Eubacteriales bacterium OttesenSCG-928-A19]|nr:hypothetical protein [Eubacteriales bacterium OttesenSCG-928-A19]
MYNDEWQDGVYREPDIEPVSTSEIANLTCTIASVSMLFALFLCFADQKSRVIRHFAVQSVGLGILYLGLGMISWILSALLGWIPVLGTVIGSLLVLVFIAASILVVVLRVRMMLRAYRGEYYVLPAIGDSLRRFE